MARRKKRSTIGGIPKIAVYGIVVVALVGGGLLLALANEDFTLFDQIILGGFFNTGEIESSVEKFALPPLALTPFDTVDCTIRYTMIVINLNGQVIQTINSGSSTSPLYVDLALIQRGQPSTSANTIKEYQLTPKLKCDNKAGSGGVLGYFLPHPQTLNFLVTTSAPSGSSLNVGTFSTPRFSHGDLGDEVERFFPKVTIPASVIDAKLPPFATVYDSKVFIAMGGQLNFEATGFSGFGLIYPYFVGLGGVVGSEHLTSVDKIGGTAVEGNQFISIQTLRRLSDNADLLSGATKINSLTQDVRESSVRVGVILQDFQEVNFNERFPTARIVQCLDTSCNTNRQIVSAMGLTRQVNTLGGDFFLGILEIPRGAEEARYAIEVSSVDRSQTSSRGFFVEQVSVSCPDPTETLIGGVCVPIQEPVCASGWSGTPPDCMLIDTTCPAGQSGTVPDCVSDTTCEEQGQVTQNDGTCADENTTTDTCASDETGTPPMCVKIDTASGAVGKIEYDAKYVATGTTTTVGCRDMGTIPTSGVALQSFGLIAGGGTCGGNQFGSIDIRAIVDFVGQTVVVDPQSVKQDARIWVSVNNPFPASPQWGTGDTTEITSTCRITGKELPTSCLISNHDFTKDTKETAFTIGQIVPVLEFRSGTTIYDISLITLSSAEIEKKVTDAGFQLKDGDEYSFLVQFVTKFKVQIGGIISDVVVPATAVHYSFNYAEGDKITCDLTKSFIETTCVELTTGEQQCTEQCTGRDNLCTDGSPKVNNQCPVPVPPNVICPQGLVPPPNVSSFTADQCVQPSSPVTCAPVPTCGVNETLDVTGTTDSCGFEILQCVPITPTTDDCPSTQIKNQNGDCVPKGEDVVPPNPTGGCDVGYDINIFGNCQRIGSGTMGNGGGGGGTDGEENFCSAEKFFENPSRCFSQIFAGGEGTDGFMLTGATATAVAVFGLVIVMVIIIAVIVRLRRRGGFGS